ncbi:MAG: class I SAM-dependent methyltransferase [Actinobacteria bacterium]|nr:class I SAM-dependent methyltransferase [Actinomycetota bacterium]
MPRSVWSSLTHHFSTVAARYNELRTTDPEPIELIARSLGQLPSVTAANVGCGTGRYTMELGQRLGKRLFVYFIDRSKGMLERLRLDPNLSAFGGFDVLRSRAEILPLPDATLDCMLTFHAIHHFDVTKFLQEAARTLRSGGLLYVYTRFRDQNGRLIWGQYFPGFAEKETRLFDEEQLMSALGSMRHLTVRELTHFSFRRTASLDCLLQRVRGRHYSTFCMYEADELERAIDGFTANLDERFRTREVIDWVDENVLLTVERV